MENKKTFFANLEPKSALIIGLVAGVLVLCAMGFIVMLVVYFGNGSKTSATTTVSQTSTNSNTATVSVTKTAKPKAELFIMSYCPYGLQMAKAYLPVMTLLKDKADLSINFVSYAMHGKKEIDENNREYCIQSEQKDKFVSYMNCFTAKDDYKTCLSTAGINESKLSTCVSSLDTKYSITKKYNDQTTWLSGTYPLYPVEDSLNTKYGVQGSPTLIINGVEAQTDRNPEAVKKAICGSFTSAPSECNTVLSSASAVAGFGTGTGADTTGVECES